MFDSLLIANRGEIACRIARTARRMGLRTVAVHSEADADALHVALADEARAIGPAPASESYLRGEAILDAARATGAQALHPGYGFLAENAAFADACADAGVVFVGPPARAIRTLGDKGEAKDLMEQAGVPVLAGYHGAAQDDKALAGAAKRVGYPLLIKPTAGGGGKGMRVVESAAGFGAALAAARREAKAAFGDDRVLLERCLERPRHVEVQIFADAHGSVVHLFERDCSLQRRHQKVVEEAPAPGIDAALRRKMTRAAVTAARAAGYVGAGTVEFLLDPDGEFYFLEMNTRLQVEHPVTEMITGLDLVEWQLRVAAGETLPCGQKAIRKSGHAIEARIYAEDPARDFLPAVGKIHHLRAPAEGKHLRVDSGVRAGDEVSAHYDPMIAKLVVWDRNRKATLGRLRAALAGFQIAGPATNLAFLAGVAAHADFAAARVDTGFIDRHREALIPLHRPAPDAVLALVCLDMLLRRAAAVARAARASRDRFSPWHLVSGWRLNGAARHRFRFRDGDEERVVTTRFGADGYRFEFSAGTLGARGARDESGDLVAELDGERRTATVIECGREITAFVDGTAYRLRHHDPLDTVDEDDATGGRLSAPMPGRIVAVMVEAGAEVARGAPLLVLEAMKMEHTITAPTDGRVARLNYGVGDLVEEGRELLAFEAEGEG